MLRYSEASDTSRLTQDTKRERLRRRALSHINQIDSRFFTSIPVSALPLADSSLPEGAWPLFPLVWQKRSSPDMPDGTMETIVQNSSTRASWPLIVFRCRPE